MVTFRNDESGYQAWLAAHPHGYVLNVEKRPHPTTLILHRAQCRTITAPLAPGATWTRASTKVCADDRADLEAWGQQEGRRLRSCGVCRP